MALSERRVGLLTAGIVAASTQSKSGSATTLQTSACGDDVASANFDFQIILVSHGSPARLKTYGRRLRRLLRLWRKGLLLRLGRRLLRL
jgi:hypothetical protein